MGRRPGPPKSPAELAAWNARRAAQLKGYRKNARRAGTITAQSHLGRQLSRHYQREGLSIVSKRFYVRFIDAEGHVWQEDTRSAEQLIADWQKEQDEKNSRKRGPTRG
jgi:hypothetical protein